MPGDERGGTVAPAPIDPRAEQAVAQVVAVGDRLEEALNLGARGHLGGGRSGPGRIAV